MFFGAFSRVDIPILELAICDVLDFVFFCKLINTIILGIFS